MNSRPLAERFVLEPARFQCFDGSYGAHRGADKLAAFKRKTATEILLTFSNELECEHVQKRKADPDRGERDIINRHCRSKDQDRRKIQRIGRNAARQQSGDLFVGGHPVRNIAGVSLGEEFDRQRHDIQRNRLIITTASLV